MSLYLIYIANGIYRYLRMVFFDIWVIPDIPKVVYNVGNPMCKVSLLEDTHNRHRSCYATVHCPP